MEPDDDESWAPRRKMRPVFSGDLLPADKAREFDDAETVAFFEQLAEGYGPNLIGMSMGWSPAMVDRFMSDPDRAPIVQMIRDARHETVERAIYLHALKGSPTAMKLYAFCQMGHRGWVDRREVRQTVEGQAELIVSVRQALNDATRDLVAAHGEDGIAALQARYLDDDEIIEGEIV